MLNQQDKVIDKVINMLLRLDEYSCTNQPISKICDRFGISRLKFSKAIDNLAMINDVVKLLNSSLFVNKRNLKYKTWVYTFIYKLLKNSEGCLTIDMIRTTLESAFPTIKAQSRPNICHMIKSLELTSK